MTIFPNTRQYLYDIIITYYLSWIDCKIAKNLINKKKEEKTKKFKIVGMQGRYCQTFLCAGLTLYISEFSQIIITNNNMDDGRKRR